MMKKNLLMIVKILFIILIFISGVYYFFIYSNNGAVKSSLSPEQLKKEEYISLGLTPEIVDKVLNKIELLKKDLERAPEYYTKILELGNMYKLLGEYDLAKAEYEKAIVAWPDESVAYNNLAHLYVLSYKDTVKGLENYLLSKEKEPTNPDVYRSIADLYRSAFPDKVNQIEALMLEGAKVSPEKKASFYEYLQNFYWYEKKFEKSLRYNQILLDIDPKNQKYLDDRQSIIADQKNSSNVQ